MMVWMHFRSEPVMGMFRYDAEYLDIFFKSIA